MAGEVAIPATTTESTTTEEIQAASTSITDIKVRVGDGFESIFPIGINNGGTGASTVAEAISNLGAATEKEIISTNIDGGNLCRLNIYSCSNGKGASFYDTAKFTYDTSTRGFKVNTLQRDYGLSNTFPVEAGELLQVSCYLQSNVTAAKSTSDDTIGYRQVRLGFAFQNASGGNFNWSFPVYMVSSEDCEKTYLSAVQEVPSGAYSAYILFGHNGYAPFEGETTVWNPVVTRVQPIVQELNNKITMGTAAPASTGTAGTIYLQYSQEVKMIFIDASTGLQISEDDFNYDKGYIITTDSIPVEFKLNNEDEQNPYYEVFDREGNRVNFTEYVLNDFGQPIELYDDDIQISYVHFYNEEEQAIADKQKEKDEAFLNFAVDGPQQLADMDTAICELYEALLDLAQR